MLLHLHPTHPQERLIKQTVELLRNGGVIIYPTDTLYALGCDLRQPKAFERICRLKNIDPSKAQFSLICRDLSHLSDFAKGMDTPLFRFIKAQIPGPFTFILPASKEVPKLMQSKKSTIGIRVPNHPICQQLIGMLGNPIISTSLPGEWVEEYTDPIYMEERFGKQVDAILDGGIGGIEPSTIIDCTGDEPVITRQGVGEIK
jgi:tRNA threonylcarbamoyl adenosine modification protein (Sua5/YciO/YrdC/YwlC family)